MWWYGVVEDCREVESDGGVGILDGKTRQVGCSMWSF